MPASRLFDGPITLNATGELIVTFAGGGTYVYRDEHATEAFGDLASVHAEGGSVGSRFLKVWRDTLTNYHRLPSL